MKINVNVPVYQTENGMAGGKEFNREYKNMTLTTDDIVELILTKAAELYSGHIDRANIEVIEIKLGE